ncbi:hypothetical protein Pmani_038908 [Petrolisthes manimaculis]|uniref:Uncharacterized protein n=1 Tax=Petrolisthes manimaculis TaxID=1843537 RepID=A0AAE1NDG7_9EUCA|nr:hypothetical protein Pmani_038908 [Petrolisthes manimaculis]
MWDEDDDGILRGSWHVLLCCDEYPSVVPCVCVCIRAHSTTRYQEDGHRKKMREMEREPKETGRESDAY